MLTRRTNLPLFLATLVIFAVAGYVWDNHDIRIAEPPGDTVPPRDTIATATRAWLNAIQIDGQSAAEVCRSGATLDVDARAPFIIVATAGGGSRAGYWTASVLGYLQDERPIFKDHLFAISGVSGGSLGAAVFRAALARLPIFRSKSSIERCMTWT